MVIIILLCVIGGLLGAYLLRKEDPKSEENVGCAGFIYGFFGTFFSWILPVLILIAIISKMCS